jgi:hypothetical protein
MSIALPQGTHPSPAQLRSFSHRTVVVTTATGSVTGNVLSYTSRSVWLIVDDDDLVVPCEEILDIHAA